MKFGIEFTPNPGENAKFVAEARFEKGGAIWGTKGWWGLWVSFWLYPRRFWRRWLFSKTFDTTHRSRLWQMMICGFEFTWQTTAKQKGMYQL